MKKIENNETIVVNVHVFSPPFPPHYSENYNTKIKKLLLMHKKKNSEKRATFKNRSRMSDRKIVCTHTEIKYYTS